MMDVGFIISYLSLVFVAISTLILIIFRKEYYFMYNHRLFFIIGLAFSRSLTSYAIITVLVWYFTYYGNDLVMSAILWNIQGSLSSLFVIFMAHAADSLVGGFHVLLFSTTAYIGGLLLLWLFNPYDVKWLVVIILVLLAFGTSGGNLLQDMLNNLVNDIDKSPGRTTRRSLARAAIWSRIAHVCGAISAILWVAPDAIGGVHSSWRSSFFICIITMTTTLMIFCKGHYIYHQKLAETPVDVFFRLFQARTMKLLKPNSRPLKNMETETNEKKENEEITQEISSLRLSIKREEEDIEVVKSLLRMFPMWGMFFVVSLISATGSTFFLQQFNNLNTSNQIVLQVYNVVQDLSSFAFPFLYRWISGSRKNEKVKIGVGMLFGIISCIFAWQLEVYRLKRVDQLSDKTENTSVSFLWLLPQFCLLGCMEGLTWEGLLKFYMSRMKDEPLRSYGEEYNEVVMCFGKLLNIFLILIFKSQLGWFGVTINDSRLDKYYLLLVFVCTANLITYSFIARYFYRDVERRQDLPDDDLKQSCELVAIDNQKQDN